MDKFVFTILFWLVFSFFSFAQSKPDTIPFGDIMSKEPMYTANAIDQIIDQNSISVYGAPTADGDIIEHKNAKAIEFDQESGFTVTTNSTNNILKVSLGSAWTWLFPDFEKVYTNILDGTTYTNSALRPSGEESISIKVVETNESGTFWGPNTNKNEKTFYIGLGEVPFERVYVSKDINIANLPYQIGRYANGNTITNGTLLSTVFNNMFSGYWTPKYTNANFSISISGISTPFEIGSYFTPKITGTFTKNDAGAATNYTYYLNGNVITNLDSNVYQLEELFGTNSISLQAKVDYGDGIVKQDSDGNDYTNGMIKAQSKISSTSTYRPSRYVFYITQDNPVENIDREFIVANYSKKEFLTHISSVYSPYSSSGSIPIGTKQIIFAYPENQKAQLSKIIFHASYGAEDDVINKTQTITINDFDCLNGYSGNIDNGSTYIIYNYKMLSPISTSGNTIRFEF